MLLSRKTFNSLKRCGFAIAAAVVSMSINSSQAEKESQNTRKWYFYTGTLSPEAAKSCKLFKCLETPIADEIAKYLGVKLQDMTVSKFTDGETRIQINNGVRGYHAYIICSTTSVDRMMELLLAISAMRRCSARSITAVIPFYGYARQDRMANGREPIAAADIAQMLEVVGVDQVVTVDLHSAQIEGFFSPSVPVENLKAMPVVATFFAEKTLTQPVVVAPHAAGVHRAMLFRDTMMRFTDDDIGLAMVLKKHIIDRSKPAEVVGDVAGRDCIVVDDLVDTATTLIGVAKQLKKAGARSVQAFCVHGRFSENAIQAIQDSNELDHLYITDTIPAMNRLDAVDKISLISIAPFLAEAIHRIQTKASVSSICYERWKKVQ